MCCTVLYLFFLFRNFKKFFTVWDINLSNPLFWEGKIIKSFDCWFQALRLLSKSLTFLPKLRPGALASRLLIQKKCVFLCKIYHECCYNNFRLGNNLPTHIRDLGNCRVPRRISKTDMWWERVSRTKRNHFIYKGVCLSGRYAFDMHSLDSFIH